MTPTQNLYYAIGELAYAVAKADGRVQRVESEQFLAKVVQELERRNFGFDIAGIIFQVLQKDKASLPDSYHWAINEIKRNSHYLSPEIKQSFFDVMEMVARAYPPVTIEEQKLMDRFTKDVSPLHGDPVYYEQAK